MLPAGEKSRPPCPELSYPRQRPGRPIGNHISGREELAAPEIQLFQVLQEHQSAKGLPLDVAIRKVATRGKRKLGIMNMRSDFWE